MKPILENVALGSELDCAGFSVINLSRVLPVPNGLVGIDDPRLNDPREMLSGSVTDESVHVIADIAQQKLDFNGVVPPSWLGTGSNQAAQGDLAERVENKGVADGYASLDENGLLPSGQVTAGPDIGTVNSVNLIFPKELSVSNSLVDDTGDLTATWADVSDTSWFGVNGPIGLSSVLLPSFRVSTIPIEIVPDLDAAKFTSGVFDPDRLPVATGLGIGHATGAVPDPQENGDTNDYLGRDMQWRPFVQNLDYQPTVPNVQITLNFLSGALQWNVTIRCDLKGSVLFYRVNASDFTEVHTKGKADNKITITVDFNDFIEAYAAKAGYNNSAIAGLKAVPPSPT